MRRRDEERATENQVVPSTPPRESRREVELTTSSGTPIPVIAVDDSDTSSSDEEELSLEDALHAMKQLQREVQRATPPRSHTLIPSAIPMNYISCNLCLRYLRDPRQCFMFTCQHIYHVECARTLFVRDLTVEGFNLAQRVRYCENCLVPGHRERARINAVIEERNTF